MDEWCFDLLLKMFNMSFNGSTQTCKAETKNGKSKKQEFCSDVPKSEKAFIYGIGQNSVPYEKLFRVTTYTEIQEGEFEEIEDTETGEASIGELENQAASERKEILRDETDESGMQGGGEEAVCGLRN